MKTNHLLARCLLLLVLTVFNLQPATLRAQGTAFTYQGRLNNGANPASGLYDFRFAIYDAAVGGIAVGALTNAATSVTNGLFTVTLDFGAGIFNGADRWLEIGVRTNGGSTFTTLTSRQPLTPTPYAILAGTANGLAGPVPVSQISGVLPLAQLPAAVMTNYATSVTLVGYFTGNFGGSFYGNGSGLTALNPANLSAGTATINISGNAATATTAATAANFTGNVSDAQLPASIARLNGTNNFTGMNTFANVVIATNANNVIAGVFTGNGGGLTNIPANALLTTPQGMALIPAGSFTMGNAIGDSDLTGLDPTNVTVSAFYMDANPVSLSQWKSVYYWATNHGYGFANAGAGKAANHPVQTVDWYDVVKWCNARSQQAGRTPVYYTDAGLTQVYTNLESDMIYVNWTNYGYRLPTGAEWEKAARGGLSGQRFPWGDVIDQSLANHKGNSGYSYDLGPDGYNPAFTNGATPYTSPPGYFAPNGYGLYDVAGNIWQWCWDWSGMPYGQPTTINPTGPAIGSTRVVRGGSWDHDGSYCRVANYGAFLPSFKGARIGFRSVLPSGQ